MGRNSRIADLEAINDEMEKAKEEDPKNESWANKVIDANKNLINGYDQAEKDD